MQRHLLTGLAIAVLITALAGGVVCWRLSGVRGEAQTTVGIEKNAGSTIAQFFKPVDKPNTAASAKCGGCGKKTEPVRQRMADASFEDVTGFQPAGGVPKAPAPEREAPERGPAQPQPIQIPSVWGGRGVFMRANPTQRWLFRWRWAEGHLRLEQMTREASDEGEAPAVAAGSPAAKAKMPTAQDAEDQIRPEVESFLAHLPPSCLVSSKVLQWTVTGCRAGQVLLVGEGPLLGPGMVDHWQLSLDARGVPVFIERAFGVSEGPGAQARRVVLFPEG